MQKGFAPILVLVGILIIAAVAGGAYYFVKNNSSLRGSKGPAAILPTPSPSPTDASPAPNGAGETAKISYLSSTDITAIQQAVAEKIGQPLAQLSVKFDSYTGQGKGFFATGQVGNASGIGGGTRWYAAKVNGTWICVDTTQVGYLTCDETNKYNMPKDLLPECLDQNNNIITR